MTSRGESVLEASFQSGSVIRDLPILAGPCDWLCSWWRPSALADEDDCAFSPGVWYCCCKKFKCEITDYSSGDPCLLHASASTPIWVTTADSNPNDDFTKLPHPLPLLGFRASTGHSFSVHGWNRRDGILWPHYDPRFNTLHSDMLIIIAIVIHSGPGVWFSGNHRFLTILSDGIRQISIQTVQ